MRCRKAADVWPLVKNGFIEKPEKYRPVSLIFVVGKLQGSILRDGIYKHLERQGLIIMVCVWKIVNHKFEFLEEVTKKVDKGRAMDVV